GAPRRAADGAADDRRWEAAPLRPAAPLQGSGAAGGGAAAGELLRHGPGRTRRDVAPHGGAGFPAPVTGPGAAQAAVRASTRRPRSASRRRITSPTTLFGVEAPAVSPTRTSPAGSQPVFSLASWVPTDRCRRASPTQSAPSMWYVGRRAAQMRARAWVLLLF